MKENDNRYKHGFSRSKVHGVWISMRQRCTNPNSQGYADYGGRGIKVCERWNSFLNFLEDMGDRPEGMTLDRINNDGDYEPSNCRWATRLEQNHNQRTRKSNTSGYSGVYFDARKMKWCARIRLNYKRIHLGYFEDIKDAAIAREEAESNWAARLANENTRR